jgi:hypothetical protein
MKDVGHGEHEKSPRTENSMSLSDKVIWIFQVFKYLPSSEYVHRTFAKGKRIVGKVTFPYLKTYIPVGVYFCPTEVYISFLCELLYECASSAP